MCLRQIYPSPKLGVTLYPSNLGLTLGAPGETDYPVAWLPEWLDDELPRDPAYKQSGEHLAIYYS